jgi:hypothetical protein
MPVSTLVAKITTAIINPIIALIFAAGFLVFVWGVVQFLAGLAQNSEAADEGKQHMLWGVIGMAIMIAATGILRMIANTIGVPL